ncbi:metal ABC transporter solute-binding protein, Zn/Mn family [Marinospirillum sp.]|uniref:metal ABC transporter solute-binding protein, Zn/Mn family n=1 Tax=Marinospirillum sp. TaxID=2183934 RepID=UPI00384CA290
MVFKKPLGWLLAGVVTLSGASALAEQGNEPLKVVTTFSILQDMAQVVGGERVEVTTLVAANEDAHVYQPRPSDSRTLATADLVMENGLSFNGWVDRLLEASGYQGERVIATQGIEKITMASRDDHDEPDDHDHDHDHGHGSYDPHAWQSLVQAQVYVDNLLAGLIKVDPEGKAYYQQRAENYQAQMQELHSAMKARFDALPDDRRIVMTPHDAFGYLADAYGLTIVAPQGVSTASEPSASEMAALVRQIRDREVTAVFMENIGDTRLVEQLQRETGAKLGGTLYSDALSSKEEEAGTYLEMLRHNLETLLSALEP